MLPVYMSAIYLLEILNMVWMGNLGTLDGDRAAVENRLEIKVKQTAEHVGRNRQFTWGHSHKTFFLRDQK